MKHRKQCPKCDSLAIGYLPSQPDEDEGPPVDRMLGITKRNLFFNDEKGGILEAYVCTSCGYHETYVKDPDTLPWTRFEGFRWVNSAPPDPQGPYR